jgi:methyl-accepting chemotaxis protein
MMAYGKAESIPRDRAGSVRLHGMIRELQKTLLRTLPLLIDRLNPGTFRECPLRINFRTRTDDLSQVAKATSPLKGFDIDDLLAEVRSTSERVRVCAEGIMDSMIISAHQTIDDNHKISKDTYTITQETKEEVVSAHQTINDNRKMSEDIHMITQQTEEGVGELRGKIDEILKLQKSFQTTLDAVSGKNGLLSFIMEHLSKF